MESKLIRDINDCLKHENKQRITLPNKKEYLTELKYMSSLNSGRKDVLFCNLFLHESVQLLINSIFLMEDGYFDCAFYSIRQASENLNNMLLLASDRSKLNNWKLKGRFPLNHAVLKELKMINFRYEEIRERLSELFDEHDKLITKSNKTIHKQGFDSFYFVRTYRANEISFNKQREIEMFKKLLESSICKIYLFFIILDPIGLILADKNLNRKLNINPITDPINIDYIKEKYPKVLNLLYETSFYRDIADCFSNKEEMNDSTCNVIRNQYFDLEKLDEIEKQKFLLSYEEQFILCILQLQMPISNFHIGGLSPLPYWTSIQSNYCRNCFSLNDFDIYLKGEQFNNPYFNVYVSVIKMYDKNLFLEHNEKLTAEQIVLLTILSNHLNNQFEELKQSGQ